MHRLRSRATAVLLAALFLGGVGGTSVVDALLFHMGRPTLSLTGPRYEPLGAPNDHAAHCLLTLRVASGRRSAPVGHFVRYAALPLVAPAPRPAAAPHRFFPGRHQDSRAPPPVLA